MNDDLTSNLPVELEELPPATQHHIALSPALVEAAQEDPDLLVQLTRGQLAVVQDRMVRRVLGDPDVSVGALATVHKALSENAQLKNQAAVAANAGAGVTINFIVGGKKDKPIEGQVIDVTPG